MTIDAAPAPVPHHIAPETVLAGRYRLMRRIATGGMGQVWEARDLVLRRPVAVKVLREDLCDRPSFMRRFGQEARLAANLTAPGIAAVHDYAIDDADGHRRALLVMELVRGQPLSSLLARDPVPPLDVTLDVLVQAAEALHTAHRHGVVHRDVKPANILVTDDGRVKLTDFGIARSLQPDPDDAVSVDADGLPITQELDLYGTPSYMSPEQARGEAATSASDVYALGVVAYQMLAGRRPFDGVSPAAIAHAHVNDLPPPLPERVPRTVRAVVEASLAKDPDRRPEDAAAMASALRRPVRVPIDAPTQRLPLTRARHRGPTALAVGTGLLATALAAGVLLRVDDATVTPTGTTTNVAAEAPVPSTTPPTSTIVLTASQSATATPADAKPATKKDSGKPAKEKGPGKGKGNGKG